MDCRIKKFFEFLWELCIYCKMYEWSDVEDQFLFNKLKLFIAAKLINLVLHQGDIPYASHSKQKGNIIYQCDSSCFHYKLIGYLLFSIYNLKLELIVITMKSTAYPKNSGNK